MAESDKQVDKAKLESRSVEVHEPELSPQTNALLTEEARGVIGSDQVEVAAGRPHPSDRESVTHRRQLRVPFPLPHNFVVAQVGAALIVVAAIAVLAIVVHRWWTLALAVLILFAMTYVVVAMILNMTSNPERPSPTTVAATEDEGVADPEELFSDIIFEFTPDTETNGENRRTAAVEDDPAGRPQSSATLRPPPAGRANPSDRPNRRQSPAHKRTVAGTDTRAGRT